MVEGFAFRICGLSSLLFAMVNSQVDETIFLYDLSSDPYEDVNLYYEENYTDTIAYFDERADYWNTQILTPTQPDSTNKSTTWYANGGVTPWLVTDFEPLTIEQKYSCDNSPHIVFVLVDDWGWNDVGFRSTYMNWTTPTIDKLASEGVILENYYTHETCSPSRGALMTGRSPLRLGMWEQHFEAELPLTEVTMAQELKSAGYKTYMVGKWHLGMSDIQHYPTQRGFDYFYGYLNGLCDYWNKTFGDFLDLQENENLVTDESEISSDLHNGYLLQTKAEAVIDYHVANFPDEPMFLYYAMQLIHGEWTAPDVYTERCAMPDDGEDDYVISVEHQYCGMNVMMDEAIANLTCALQRSGLSSNTVLIIASDNGGEPTVKGNSYPFRGHKGSYFKGGVSATAIIHSEIMPEDSRGSTYSGLMHVTDWLPTLMGIATDGEWTGSYSGMELDGDDMWEAIMTQDSSRRFEVVHYVYEDAMVLQTGNLKYFTGVDVQSADEVTFVFEEDLSPSSARMQCSSFSLIDSEWEDSSFALSAAKTTTALFGDFLGTEEISQVNMLSGLVVLLLACVAAVVWRNSGAEKISPNVDKSEYIVI